MMEIVMHWLLVHTALITEVLGVLFALIYLWFSIKQNIWLWPFGLLTSFFYILVFFHSRLYADMGLQVYYLVISLYGWYHWKYGGQGGKEDNLPVIRTGKKEAGFLLLASFVIYWILVGVLTWLPRRLGIPSSQMILWDAFTTAGSIVATWMLARKMLEHWLIWVVVDLVSMGMYIYKGLYLTAFLFLVYTVMAVVGYREWKRGMRKDERLSIIDERRTTNDYR
jgi:nicotinamide mononucleotide transporter